MNVLSAQAFRLIAVQRGAYRPDVIRALIARYDFARAPATADEINPPDPATPMTFQHGRLSSGGRDVHIDTLRVFADTPRPALAIDCQTSTEDADLVLDDIIATSDGLVIDTEQRRLYASQIEFTLKPWLETRSNLWARTAIDLTVKLAQYGGAEQPAGALPPAFRMIQVAMRIDPGQWALPTDFRIERRANTPWEANAYYSAAPLRTNDHIEVLETFVRRIEGLNEGTEIP